MRTYAIYQHGFYATQALAHAAMKALSHIPSIEFVELEIPTDKNAVLALLNSEPLAFEVIDRFRLTPRGGFVRIDPNEPQRFVAGNGPKKIEAATSGDAADDDEGGDEDADGDTAAELDLGTADPDAFKPRIGGPQPVDIWSKVFGIDFRKHPPADPHRPASDVGAAPDAAPAATAAVDVVEPGEESSDGPSP